MRDNNWLTALDLVLRTLTVASIPVALMAFRLSWRTHAERSTFEMVDKMYSLCHILQDHVQKTWYLGHLHCIDTGTYYRTVDLIRGATHRPAKRAQRLIEERQFVIRTLMVFEQIFYQWSETHETHVARKKFLKAMLDYFVLRLLPNPRMLAYIDADSSGASLHMEAESANYLRAHVRRWGIVPDHAGPFDFDPAKAFHRGSHESG